MYGVCLLARLPCFLLPPPSRGLFIAEVISEACLTLAICSYSSIKHWVVVDFTTGWWLSWHVNLVRHYFGCFLRDEMNNEVHRRRRADCPSEAGGPHPISWPPESQKADPLLSRRGFLLLPQFQAGIVLFFFCFLPSDSDWNITPLKVFQQLPPNPSLPSAPFNTSAFMLETPQISEPFWGSAGQISLLLTGCRMTPATSAVI